MAGGNNIAGSTATAGTSATGAGTKIDVTLKLSQLQNLCKRDPVGYKDDYEIQIQRLESEFAILKLDSTNNSSSNLQELIQFAAAVSSSSYKGKESDRIANLLIGLLVGTSTTSSTENNNTSGMMMMATILPTSAIQLPRELRKSCVSALILMRNKGVLEPLRLLELFFRLMATIPDKILREILYKHIVNDVRNINKKGKRDEKVNRSIQSFLHRIISTHSGQQSATVDDEESASDIATKRATDIVCELYRREVWTDQRTVAILASAVMSSNITVMARAMRFFLNIEEKMLEDQQQLETQEWNASQKIDYHKFSRKTKSRQRHVERQVENRKRQQRKREGTSTDEWMDVSDDVGVEQAKKLYPAIELLRDPQGLAEYVLKRLKNGNQKSGSTTNMTYKIKLLMMNFVTRLVGNHELQLLALYPYLQKYMNGSQRDVTAILAYTVQACHEYVPPQETYGILKTIAHNFVTERCSEEQMAVGINAIRAISSRTPSVLSIEESKEESLTGTTAFDVEAFVRDIAAYSNHRDRSVSIAGKAYTNFIRETYPTLLQGKDRGLKGSALHRAKVKPMRYGQQNVSYGVEGADLLVEYESKKAAYLKKEKMQNEDDEDNAEELDEKEEMEEIEEEMIEMDSEDEEAPNLIVLDPNETAAESVELSSNHDDEVIDLSKMTSEEREQLKQKVSSTRIFTAADFAKMRKLVEREQRAKRDPREAARRKRAIARGQEFEELSDEENDNSDDEEDQVHIKGAVKPNEIVAEAKRKRQSKAEKLEKVLAGREAFESKARAGGSTNTEKQRRKNFMMIKSSKGTRSKGRGKGGLSSKRGHGGKKSQMGHEAKKRRRKY